MLPVDWLYVRLTDGWIYKEHPGRPLTFQTIPQSKLGQGTDIDEDEKKKATDARDSSVANIPRLISVVEIIKREYAKKKEASDDPLLYQYNHISSLEESKLANTNESMSPDEKVGLGAVDFTLGSTTL